MKNIILLIITVSSVLFSAAPFSAASPFVKKKNVGILIAKTRDTDLNKLGSVPFTVDGKGYETNDSGRRRVQVAAKKTHTIEFGEVEGYTIISPKRGTQTFTVEAGKTKTVVAIYEKAVSTTPTPTPVVTPTTILRPTPTVAPVVTPTAVVPITPVITPTPAPTATATPTPTPKTATIPWQMFHYNAQHTGQSHVNGPQTNNLKWKYTRDDIAEGTVPNSISIDSSGTLYVTAANKLLAIDADGNLLWSKEVGGIGATAISSDESTIYVVGGKALYAFSSSGDEQLWRFTEPTDNIYGEPAFGSDGAIYIGSWDTYVYAVNPDGSLKWKYQTDGSIAPLASPTLSNDGNTIYVGTSDGEVYAITASTGKTKWSYQTGPNPDSTGNQNDPQYGVLATIVIGADGVIYVGAMDGVMHALNADGSVLWKYTTGDNINENCPAIGPDGSLYFSSADKYLYAIKDE